ncbi:MAG: sugar transferase [Bryobacteraceae bacterium]
MIRLFRVFIPTSIIALLVSEIILVFCCFLVATYALVPLDPTLFLLYEDGFQNIALVVASVMLGLYFQDLYTNFRIRSRILLIQQVLLVIGIVFLFQALLAYINPRLTMPRWIMIFGCMLVLFTVPLWRLAYTSVIYKGFGVERLLFLGSNPVAREIAERFSEHPELGFISLGFVDDIHSPGESLPGGSVLGSVNNLRQIVADQRPDRIVVGVSERRGSLPVYDLLDLRFSGIRIVEAATTYEAAFGRVPTRELRPSQLVFSSELGPHASSLRLQTIYSIALGLIGVILTAPVMMLVAIGVKLTSSGPILFRQKRVGMNGTPFTLYKFRSMVADAEAKTGAVWAKRDDPRVTGFGKITRRTRLDELPQLFNVIRGEMSIVGPRPERPEFVVKLSEQIPFYPQRHCVKPGITGWAQINYKYGDTLEDTIIKLEYDLFYIKNLSPSLDAYIIFHTIKVMLSAQSGQ